MIVLRATEVPAWDRALFLALNLDAQSSGAVMALAQFSSRWLPFVLLAILLGISMRSAPWRRPLWSVAMAMVLAWAGASLLKDVITAPRPFMLGLGTDWLGHSGGNGFPSSHASVASACAVAVLLSAWPRALRWSLAIACALVCWSRIALGVHFPSDVAAAVVLGSLCGVAAHLAVQRLRGRGPRTALQPPVP